jgi:hypothetical protein
MANPIDFSCLEARAPGIEAEIAYQIFLSGLEIQYDVSLNESLLV